MIHKKTPSYAISVHIKNKERTLRMEVPIEKIQDKPSREKIFNELMESALNMLGEPDLANPQIIEDKTDD